MKDYFIISLLIIILVILLSRRLSSYTTEQLDMITPAIPQRVAQSGLTDIIDIIINLTKGSPVMSSVNSLINNVNTIEPSAKLVPYTSEQQIADMFDVAYKNGESSLTHTDKAILRFTILIGIDISKMPWGSGNLPTISFTNDGKPVWADEIIGQTGLTINQGIIKIMELAKEFGPDSDKNAFITKVNSILPPNLTPFASFDDYLNKGSSMTDPSAVWFSKFVSIGPLYLLWVAENKWIIDFSWRLTQDTAVQNNQA